MTAPANPPSDRPMISLDDSRAIAVALAGLADPIRMRVLQLLLPGPLCVGDLARHLGLPMVNTSHHLKVMRRAGILEHQKQGRQVMYSLNPKVHTAGTPRAPGGALKVGSWELHLGSPPPVNGSANGHANGHARRAKAVPAGT